MMLLLFISLCLFVIIVSDVNDCSSLCAPLPSSCALTAFHGAGCGGGGGLLPKRLSNLLLLTSKENGGFLLLPPLRVYEDTGGGGAALLWSTDT